jgi:hypothetical protein
MLLTLVLLLIAASGRRDDHLEDRTVDAARCHAKSQQSKASLEAPAFRQSIGSRNRASRRGLPAFGRGDHRMGQNGSAAEPTVNGG